ncbi:MAG: DUF3098 domain-containing protein [Bacteroidaceae bacterium]|jgi:uncharacterized membrane protein|nr:DUF3098 domain-containing protein [Bacteroidales bacterium]MBQ3122183.1 DUF3098 domain-containing protein [Bacteroidaceae bacterium]MBQ4038617.1 DUF3098 domain-containing protein [Bacteroidaceae bacterium]MBQ5705685.1 DUF3098 domain-containing protein [Bacteroidaceae bacterium]
MSNRKFAFEKANYLLLAIGFAIIIIGFLLMAGPGSTETHFEPDIFSFRRIKLAPTVCFFGFIFVIYAILYSSKKRKDENKEEQ